MAKCGVPYGIYFKIYYSVYCSVWKTLNSITVIDITSKASHPGILDALLTFCTSKRMQGLLAAKNCHTVDLADSLNNREHWTILFLLSVMNIICTVERLLLICSVSVCKMKAGQWMRWIVTYVLWMKDINVAKPHIANVLATLYNDTWRA